MKGEARTTVNAPPETLFHMVSDVTRMGEWSPETFSCEWVGDATGPAVGARFKGRNRMGPAKWATTPKVVACEPGREFAFDTGMMTWRYQFEPVEGGTQVTESWDAHTFFAKASVAVWRGRQLTAGMRKTLANLKRAAEAAN